MNTLKRLCIKRGRRFGNSTKNLGTWETGKLGTWETGNPGTKKKFISSHQFDGEALERTPI